MYINIIIVTIYLSHNWRLCNWLRQLLFVELLLSGVVLATAAWYEVQGLILGLGDTKYLNN